MVTAGESDNDEVSSEETRPSESSDTEIDIPKETELPENGITTLEPDNPAPIKSDEREPVTDTPRSNQGEKSSPKKPKKALQIPESSALALVHSQEVSTPSSIREKVSEDGYNWRKYGQKLVKGNEYVRSYYRCTHPNCPVKKQLERLHEGKIVDIVYFGQHAHSKPQVNIPVAVGFDVSIVEERRKELSLPTAEVIVQSPKTPLPKPVDTPPISKALAIVGSKGTITQSNKSKDEVFSDDDPDPKRQKKERDSLKSTALDKSSSDSRLVIQTRSEVDVVNDGYRWRKYGQKLVKGNLNPRSYYRCSNSGCPVKKHVERASHDPRVVITTYEGQHSHGAPPARVVTYNISGSSDSPPTPNSESGPKSDGNAPCLDLVVDAILEDENKSENEPNAKLEKPHKIKPAVKEENTAAESKAIKSNLEGNNNNSCAVDMVVRDGMKTEVKNPDLEPVQGRIKWR